ncbi:monothiol glutaredoxin grx5 [Arachnomyces sp. PD_36]|nr:monothiol glutaredoxin grx5 [Arachnomyces sp. PD_36]
MFSRSALSSVFRQASRPCISKTYPTQTPFAIYSRFLSNETRAAITKAVDSAPVVLFMKGTPETPQCGFSRASIQILGLQGVDPGKFTAFNVLEDPELRQGIKEFSDWPTIPQLYVEKEFVGGCDILMSMHQNGELSKLLGDKGVLVASGAPHLSHIFRQTFGAPFPSPGGRYSGQTFSSSTVMAKRDGPIQYVNGTAVSTFRLLNRSSRSRSISSPLNPAIPSYLVGRRNDRGRISKPQKIGYPKHFGTKGSTGPIEPQRVTEFTQSITATRSEISNDTRKSLAQEEQAAVKKLTNARSQDFKKIPSEHAHSPELLSPICESTGRNGAGMHDAQKAFEETERELKGLWREWSKIQQKIACLGVEVLGVAGFTNLKSGKSGVCKRRLEAAMFMSRENQEAEEYARSILQTQGEEIQNSTRGTIRTGDFPLRERLPAQDVHYSLMYMFIERVKDGTGCNNTMSS